MSEPGKRPEAILVLHGLGGDSREVEPIVSALRKCNSLVVAPTFPGHGTSGFWMPPSTWQAWYETIESQYLILLRDGYQISVVGFSTGATLALHLAAQQKIEKLVLISPFMRIRSPIPGLPLEPLVRALHRVIPQVPRRSPAVRDPEARRRLAQEKVPWGFSLKATKSALDLIEIVKPEVAGLQNPCLAISPALDTVVDPQGARWVIDNLGSPDKRLVELLASDHLAQYDFDRQQVIEEILGFFGLTMPEAE